MCERRTLVSEKAPLVERYIPWVKGEKGRDVSKQRQAHRARADGPRPSRRRKLLHLGQLAPTDAAGFS